MPTSSPILDVETAGRLRASIGRLSRGLRTTDAGSAAGLTPTRTSVLLAVVREGPLRISELARSEGLNPTMLSRVIAGFVDAGLLSRTSDDGDRRSAWVDATEAGTRLAQRMRAERTDVLNRALEGLPAAQLGSLEAALPALEALAEQLWERRP